MSQVDREYWRPVFVTVSHDDGYMDVVACAFHNEIDDLQGCARVEYLLMQHKPQLRDRRYTATVVPCCAENEDKFPQEHDVLHVSLGGCEIGQP